MKRNIRVLFLIIACFSSLVVVAQPLKILVPVSSFPPHSGSAVLNQITGLIDRGHDVSICTKRPREREKEHSDIARYNLKNRIYYYNRSGDIRSAIPNIDSFDIIYCQFGTVGTEWAEFKKKYGIRGKLVTCFRGDDITRRPVEDRNFYNNLFKVGDLFFPVCDYFKRLMVKMGCKANKIIVHHSAIDCKRFRYKVRTAKPNGQVQLVSVCRFVEKKGLEYAIRAVAQLQRKYPNIRYEIVGFGPLLPRLQALIRQLGMGRVITIHSLATEEEVANILDTSDIFILPSTTDSSGSEEGIPNALKEAMAMGLPVVSTYHAGIPELVDNGVSGFLVPERDVRSLVQKIQWLIENADKWARMGLVGRKRVEQEYEKEQVNDRLVELFNQLVKR